MTRFWNRITFWSLLHEQVVIYRSSHGSVFESSWNRVQNGYKFESPVTEFGSAERVRNVVIHIHTHKYLYIHIHVLIHTPGTHMHTSIHIHIYYMHTYPHLHTYILYICTLTHALPPQHTHSRTQHKHPHTHTHIHTLEEIIYISAHIVT